MREIDFLPEWYRRGRRRQRRYRAQYAALGGILAVMMLWNFMMGSSVNKAEARLESLEVQHENYSSIEEEYSQLSSKREEMREADAMIAQLSSRLDVAGTLGEIGYLIGENITVTRMNIISELLRPGKMDGKGKLRAAGSAGSKSDKHICDLGFKVVITGVAREASDVAALICNLENSAYFRKVMPSYSRNREIRIQSEEVARVDVTEFEVVCTLANYSLEGVK